MGVPGVEDFLAKNEKLILKEARKRFSNFFNESEVKSEAALAFYDMLSYMNSKSKTKSTTVFVWFLSKRLNRALKFGVMTYEENSNSNNLQVHDSFEDTLYTTCGSINDQLDEEYFDPPAYGDNNSIVEIDYNVAKYDVCLESFEGVVSKQLLYALKLLSLHAPSSQKIDQLSRIYNCKRTNFIAKRIRKNIIDEVSRAGLKVYSGTCLNGSQNKVIVCASSEKDAEQQLLRYGKVIQLTSWEF